MVAACEPVDHVYAENVPQLSVTLEPEQIVPDPLITGDGAMLIVRDNAAEVFEQPWLSVMITL